MKLRTSHHVVSPDEVIKAAVDPEDFEVILINEAIGKLPVGVCNSVTVTVYIVDLYTIITIRWMQSAR